MQRSIVRLATFGDKGVKYDPAKINWLGSLHNDVSVCVAWHASPVKTIQVLPCTFWNRFDNDHGHRAWVHRATALRKNRRDILVIRHEQVEECDYGWRGFRSVASDKEDAKSSMGLVKGERESAEQALRAARYIHWFMPNVRLWFQRSRAKGYENRDLWDTKTVWIVPINDGAHAAFDVTHTPLEGDEARAYAAARAEQETEAETRWDLAEKILAGEMTLKICRGT